MTRILLAACAALACTALVCASLVAAGPVAASDPKPAWEINPSGVEKSAAPAWLSYSPDGAAVVAVTAGEATGPVAEYAYHLRVYDADTRKERFNAALGAGKTFHWGDELAAFPTDDTVTTGGQANVTRNLLTGVQINTLPTGGMSDFAVWAVPDLKESFFLRRDPNRYDLPVELFLRSLNPNQFSEFRGGFGRGGGPGGQQFGIRNATIDPPRAQLRTESIALNPGRTHAAVAFRDESGTIPPRHALVLYRIRTIEAFDLAPAVEATPTAAVSALAFARNGQTLATGGEDGSVSFWDTAATGKAWKPRATVAGAAGHRVYALAFSPDWRYVAAVTWDKYKPNLLLIDADAGKLMRAIRLERILTAVAWHPEGHTLLTAGASGKIQAWDAAALVKGN